MRRRACGGGGYRSSEVVALLLMVDAPDALAQEAVGAQPAGIGGQHLEESILGLGQPHRLPVAGDASGLEIDLYSTGLDDARAPPASGRRAPPAPRQVGHQRGAAEVGGTPLGPPRSRSSTVTLAPAAASRRAQAAPMPLAAPVTSAVRPSSTTLTPAAYPTDAQVHALWRPPVARHQRNSPYSRNLLPLLQPRVSRTRRSRPAPTADGTAAPPTTHAALVS